MCTVHDFSQRKQLKQTRKGSICLFLMSLQHHRGSCTGRRTTKGRVKSLGTWNMAAMRQCDPDICNDTDSCHHTWSCNHTQTSHHKHTDFFGFTSVCSNAFQPFKPSEYRHGAGEVPSVSFHIIICTSPWEHTVNINENLEFKTVLLQVRTEHFITFHHIWQTFAAGINDSNCKCCCQVHLPYLTMLSIVLIQSAYATKPKYFQQEWKNRCMSYIYIYIYIHIYITIHIFSPLPKPFGVKLRDIIYHNLPKIIGLCKWKFVLAIQAYLFKSSRGIMSIQLAIHQKNPKIKFPEINHVQMFLSGYIKLSLQLRMGFQILNNQLEFLCVGQQTTI